MALFESPYRKSRRRPVKRGYAGDGVPGFGDPAAGIGSLHSSSTPSFGGKPLNPLNQPKTDAEVTAYRNKSGIAPTAQNMGSLAVQYRADEATAREGGGQSVGDKRAQKVIDTRRTDETKRLKDNSAAALAFRKRAREAIHTNSTNTPGSRRSRPQLGSAKAPNAGIRPNSTYGLF